MSRAGEPVLAAYQQTDALSVPCPRCGVAVEDFCVDHHGRRTRVPHIRRCADARRAADPHGGLNETSPPDDGGAQELPIDFTEPRHPRGVADA